MPEKQDWTEIKAAKVCTQTINPIRKIVDQLKPPQDSKKPLISLSIGDPTVFGNFNPPENVSDEIQRLLKNGKHNGYLQSFGSLEARTSIAKESSFDGHTVSPDDVIIASGCSGALDLIFTAMCEPGVHNVLLPRPGFSLYTTLAHSKSIEIRYYDLIADDDWKINLKHLSSLIDGNTAFIMINNPSNPCGSVYDFDHLKSILQVANQFKTSIVSDEIYAHMSFDPYIYYSLAQVAVQENIKVPILSVGGLAKRFMVPGWRVGWIVIHDLVGNLRSVKSGIVSLTQLILGANSLIQGIVPFLLEKSPKEYYSNNLHQLKQSAVLGAEKFNQIPGLKVVMPKGAMYMMVGIQVEKFNGIKNDVDFSEKLLQEESVVVLPGQCFQFPNYFRIVLTLPQDKMVEAIDRIQNFCKRHYIQ